MCSIGLCKILGLSMLITAKLAINGSAAPTSPKFTEEVYETSVPETFVEGRPEDGFIHVGCLDPVTGEGRNVTYSIAEPDPGPFSVDNSTGSLSVTADLDYETNPSYTFHVRCRDIEFPSLTATATVLINIGSVNEYLPEVSPQSRQVFVSENQTIGTVIASSLPDASGLVTYTVTDMDGGPHGIDSVRYTLSEESEDFTLNFTTGALVLSGSLDVNNTSSGFDTIVISITACDVQPPLPECPNFKVTLLVFAVNDNFPQFSQNTYELSVSETTPVNSTLDLQLECTDADRGVGEFEGIELVDSTLSSIWDVETTQGNITLREQLDFEVSDRHEFVVICFDTGGLEDVASVVINVIPVNDNPPQFNQTEYRFTVDRIDASSSYTVGQVSAYDLDQETGNIITYSIEENSNFDIDARDGTIIVVDYILEIDGSTFELIVEASDGQFTDQVRVTIDIVGPLSVLEIAVVSAAGLLLILIPLIVVCCCIIRVRCRSRKAETLNREAMAMTDCAAYRNNDLNVLFDDDGYAIPNHKPTGGFGEGLHESMKSLPQDKDTQNDYDTLRLPCKVGGGST